MEQCIFCQGDLEPRRCQECGRTQPEQPESALAAPLLEQNIHSIACPACGESLPAHAQFCLRCGQPLRDTAAPLPPDDPEDRLLVVDRQRGGANQASATWSRRALAAALVVVVVAVASFGLYLSSHAPEHSTPVAVTTRGTAPPATTLLPTATNLPPPTPEQLALTFNAPAAADMNGLHIQTDGLFCGRYLVFAHPPSTYDDATLAQMRSYVTSLVSSTPLARLTSIPVLPGNLPPLPDVLQWAAGAGVIGASGVVDEGCAGILTITNTRATSLQIKQFGVIYATDSVENTYPYRLVGVCSLLQVQADCPSGLGSNGCSPTTSVNLTQGSAGKIVTTPISLCSPGSLDNNPVISPQTLAPAQTIVLKVGFNSLPSTLSYRVHLTLGVNTEEAGATLLILPASFDSTLVFITAFDPYSANSPNMACYSLQGNTFAPLPPPPAYDYCM